MRAKYIYRLDDITPNMNWGQFCKFINIFRKNNVIPVLGVVPDNQDEMLVVEESQLDFWSIIKDMQDKKIVEIAQHGYQHKLFHTKEKGLMGVDNNFLTEFAGLPYEVQFKMIQNGKNILRSKGIYTDVWMAPCHSFDFTTVRVLKNLGYKAISDGIALYPNTFCDLIFVPQQIWAPRYFPCGIFTICLHLNNADEKLIKEVENHIKSGANVISFNDARKHNANKFHIFINRVFRICYILRRKLKKTLKKAFNRSRLLLFNFL